MANVANPRKVFNFEIEVDGILQFEAQKVTEPEREIEVTEHGDTNYKVKTPGMAKTGDMTIEKLKPADAPDPWAQIWFNEAQNVQTGSGQLPSQVKRNLVLREKAPNGTVLGVYVAEGSWIKKIAKNDKDRTSSDNVLETITLSVDKYYEVI